MDSDRIIVTSLFNKLDPNNIISFRFKCLSDGQLMDIGVPYDLLQNSNTILYQLLNKLSKQECNHLYEIARTHKFSGTIREEDRLSSDN